MLIMLLLNDFFILFFCLKPAAEFSLSQSATRFAVDPENNQQYSRSVWPPLNTQKLNPLHRATVFTVHHWLNVMKGMELQRASLLCNPLLWSLWCSPLTPQLLNDGHENKCFSCVLADIEDLPPAVQEKLFDDVLDRDVQKGIWNVFFSYISEMSI